MFSLSLLLVVYYMDCNDTCIGGIEKWSPNFQHKIILFKMLQILLSKSLKSVQNTSVTSGSITLLQNWQFHIRTVKGRQKKKKQTNKQAKIHHKWDSIWHIQQSKND